MFDIHVHSAPDVIERLGDDDDVAEWFAADGASGFVLKNHFESTAGRSALLRQRHRIVAYGGIALNAQVGGFNPVAVEVALAMGARVVWMPTVHARAHSQQSAGPKSLVEFSKRVTNESYAAPPIDWGTESPLRAIFELIADADAVLATGHLSGREIAWMVPAARAAGVRRVLLTHPSFSVPGLSAEEVATLTDHGAFAEVTAYQLLHQAACDRSSLAAFIKRVGPDRILLSSDAGQPDSPSPPAALRLLIDALSTEGIDRALLDEMASDAPRRLVDVTR